MTGKGKHASDSSGAFYRDLTIMILGILVIGALVFIVLYYIAGSPETGPTTTTTVAATTSTTEMVTSTTEEVSRSTSTSVSTSTTLPMREPAELTIVVLNSMGLDGAAGRLTAELAAAGYQTLPPDDYDPELAPSRIWFRDGFAAEANALLDFIPGATVEALPDGTLEEGADIVMVLGTGYEE